MSELSLAEKDQKRTTWLQSLKVGDEVALTHNSFAGIGAQLVKITKITATQIVVGSNRFRRDSGRMVGDAYSRTRLEEASQELKKQIADQKEISNLGYKLESMCWRDQPIDVLRAVNDIVKAVKS